MITEVFVTLQREGMHSWPDAKNVFPEVDFLSDQHRHMFHFKLYKKVNHDDRDIEFIMFKRAVQSYLSDMYGAEYGTLFFGSMSCEMIALNLLNQFQCTRVEVSEDGENGAIVTT